MSKFFNLKKVVAGVLTVATVIGSGAFSSIAYATESYTWSSAKIPGSTTTSSTARNMTYYAGDVYFKATSLNTDSSYVAGRCEGVDVTINNTNKYVLVSKINTPVTFKIVPASARTTMKFNMYIVHNASYAQNANGAGNIYY